MSLWKKIQLLLQTKKSSRKEGGFWKSGLLTEPEPLCELESRLSTFTRETNLPSFLTSHTIPWRGQTGTCECDNSPDSKAVWMTVKQRVIFFLEFCSLPTHFIYFYLKKCIVCFPLPFSLLTPSHCHSYHTVVHVCESFFFFAKSLHPYPTLTP